jgi:RNA polymerase sigma-70 factor (sigma-E family)
MVTERGGVDDDGFREFVTARYANLLRTAYLLTGDRDTADDLLQSALLKAMGRWRRVDDPQAYLYRIMVNHQISGWRRPWRRREWLTDSVPDRPAVPDTAELVADRAQLLSALATLPPRMRSVLVLRYWADLSEAQTAELLGCSVGTVKSQASRGLERLRPMLRPDLATGKGGWS